MTGDADSVCTAAQAMSELMPILVTTRIIFKIVSFETLRISTFIEDVCET